MNYTIRFSDEAKKVVAKYKKSNPIAFKKLSKLLTEITEHPREGRYNVFETHIRERPCYLRDLR